MSGARRPFPPELLAGLRNMSVTASLDRLGLYWKRDTDFKPIKHKQTERVTVSLGGGVVELLATGPKWYDTGTGKGGGGAIDLTMHLLHIDFVGAVKLLLNAEVRASSLRSHAVPRGTVDD